ncbi:MAG: metallophosphoesterase [Chlamydiales bacterium]
MRIAQLSDFHFTQLTWNPLRLFSKRVLGNLNWLFLRQHNFFEGQLESLPTLFQELSVDWVLLGGDFSTTSLPEEFEKGVQFVKALKSPWIAIPGNHDRYTRGSCRDKDFYRFFTNPKRPGSDPVGSFTLKEDRIEAHRLSPEWRLIALDTCLATNFYSSQGEFSPQLEASLEEVLRLIPQRESILLLNHYPFFQNDIERHNLIRGEALQRLLERNPRIRLYLHGHTHRHIVADLQISHLPIVLDGGSCAQGDRGSWNLIDLSEKSCAVSTYRWNQKWTQTTTQEFTWTRPTYPGSMTV